MNTKTLTILLLGLTSLALLAGCSGSTDPALGAPDISGDNSMDAIDLDLDYGGLGYTDEEVGFGDEVLVAEAMREDDLGLTASHGDTTVEDGVSDLQRVWVRILWGRLDGRPELDAARDENSFEPVDWSGTLSVDDGVVVLKRTLLFEYPYDHPLPRDSRQSLGWVSHTGPHKDGILVCIGVPRDVAADRLGSMNFETGPLGLSIPLATLLAGVDRTVDTDIEGNSVSFQSTTDHPDRCPHGFVGGYWQKIENDEHQGGVFRGRVLNANGRLVGYLAGRYGVNGRGEKVFRGKLIGRDGNIRGLVRGGYEHTDEGTGIFHGVWVNREGQPLGEMKGVYIARGEGAGFFHGVWSALCRD